LKNETVASRIYALDACRGIAALSVVLWHWQHFYMLNGSLPATFRRSEQPLYAVLWIFYEQGGIAVDFFFGISGFVFFRIYQEKIRHRLISARAFWMLRFSRLYPLYLATLLIVLVAQLLIASRFHFFFVYQANDWQHFLANLFVLQQWNIVKGDSFNGPAWSISIELAMYLLFYAFCRYRIVSTWSGVLIVAVCGIVVFNFDKELGRGVMGFFVGGAVSMLLDRYSSGKRSATWVSAGAAAGWLIVVLDFNNGWLHQQVRGLAMLGPVKLLGWYDSHSTGLFLVLFIFTVIPLTISSLALCESNPRLPFHRAAWIGDISYSSYLIHFPLQLIVAALMLNGVISTELRGRVWFLLLFYGVLIPLSLLVYHYFERPAQNWIRSNWVADRYPKLSGSEVKETTA
jgi:peptidoglycan/LPS O-acetylase OafA/YrhL